MTPAEDLITDDEKAMLSRIAKIAGYKPKDHGYLEAMFQTIKIQGLAYRIDIAPLMNLGIPIYHELSKIRQVPVADISQHISTNTVIFEEIRQVFVNLTSEGGIYS